MDSRLSLHEKLVSLLGSDHVYFQPPESIRMKYPCFVYERSSMDTDLADDTKYLNKMRYELMYISKEPDTNSFIKTVIETFRYCSYNRHFVSDGLNHEVFDLYY